MVFFKRPADKGIILSIAKNWPWFMVLGLALIALGCAAIAYSTTTTLVSVIILGIVLTIAGIMVLIDAFQLWGRKGGGFFLQLIMGILYLLVGASLIKGPLIGAMSITLLLAVFYILVGIFRLVTAFSTSLPSHGWMIFSGIVAILLGVLILLELPASGLFIIGLFVGIDLLFNGWMYIMAAIAGRRLSKVV